MIHTHAPTSSRFIAALDLLTMDENTTPLCIARESTRATPVLEPSIAESAGLNRFVYIVGRSKHRYVFSSIQPNQISLYSEAVFVVIERSSGSKLWVGDYTSLIAHLNQNGSGALPSIYVHLLAEGDQARSHVISDLFRSCPDHSYC